MSGELPSFSATNPEKVIEMSISVEKLGMHWIIRCLLDKYRLNGRTL